MGLFYPKRGAIPDLLRYWAKHSSLDSFHEALLHRHAEVLQVKQGHRLQEEGIVQRNIYFVCKGLIARQIVHDDGRRSLLTIATPHMALFTTVHPYTSRASLGEIVSILPSLVLRIPYNIVLPYRYKDPAIERLIDIFINKKKAQTDQLRLLSTLQQPTQRYIAFAKRLPDLNRLLTEQEIADLLQISRSTVQRAQRLI